MAVQIQGGPALNVAVDSAGTNAQRTGGPAIPVAVVTDGRAVQAGPARRVVVIANPSTIQGGPAIPVVAAASGAAVEGGPAMRVYVVQGSFNTTTPPILLDTFTGADGTSIASHTPDVAPGGSAWAQTAATSFYIQSNALQPNRQTDGDLATISAGVSDYSLTCTVTPVNNAANIGYPCIVFRYTNTTNFWYAFPDPVNARVQLFSAVGGVHTERIRYPTTVTSGVSLTIRIDCKGPNITLWVEGTEVATFVSSFNQSATTVGLRYGKSGTPTGRPVWDNFQVTTFAGLNLNWPLFTKSGSNPLIPLGAATAWDDTDVNNPNIAWDADNTRWACHYSGYGADVANVQNAGMAYAAALTGPWTKSASNPVATAAAFSTGIYGFNGGLVKKGSTWYLYYGTTNSTKIGLATATNLDGPWTDQGIVLQGTAAAWDSNGVFDVFVRIKQDGVTFDLWYGGTDGTTRKIGRATSTDGVTFTKDAANPIFSTPALGLTQAVFGEPSVYVPPSKEGTEMLVSFDTALSTAPNNRFISQAITVDGGATWHYRVAALEKSAAGWDNQQAFDSFVLVDSGTMYLFYGGANVAGAAMGLNIQIGVASVAWAYTTLRG